jgi:hypothetical protein
MTTAEAIEIAEKLAINHKNSTFATPGGHLVKQWLKSIEEIDKTQPGGFSLVGKFATKKEQLTSGLFLLFNQFQCRKIEKIQTPERDSSRRLITDDNGNIKFVEVGREIVFWEFRGILLDIDQDNIELIHYAWMPARNWARELWSAVEEWLNNRPRIEIKIKYWEAEVLIRRAVLEEAQHRLAALRNQYSGGNGDLSPEMSDWLQTAAVLSTKRKATEQGSLKG